MMLTLPAPAKLNLCLHITGRRPDGYHDLQTLFQLLDFGDELTFEPSKEGEIRLLSGMDGVADEDNLVMRAARQLAPLRRHEQGVHIRLHKRLPSGGGLGGGSSDAATTLLALNHLWALGLSEDRLAAIGLTLGADVPVFVRGRTAWAEGLGERLEAVTLPRHWYLVLCPDCQVSTAEVFSQRELTRDSSAITIRAFLERGGRNDCQPVVEKLYPAVKNARLWLERFAPAQMTGTGACLFARFSSRQAALAVLDQKPEQWQGFVARGVNTSPLHTVLSTMFDTGVSPSG